MRRHLIGVQPEGSVRMDPAVVQPKGGATIGGALLGPGYSTEAVTRWLDENGIEHEVIVEEDERCRVVAGRLVGGS